MSHQVNLIQEAEDDLFRIIDYIAAHDSPEKAYALLDKLEEYCRSLNHLPERGHIPPELQRINVTQFLEIRFKPYRIIYEVDGNKVLIHCVLDGRRDQQDLLEARLLR